MCVIYKLNFIFVKKIKFWYKEDSSPLWMNKTNIGGFYFDNII